MLGRIGAHQALPQAREGAWFSLTAHYGILWEVTFFLKQWRPEWQNQLKSPMHVPDRSDRSRQAGAGRFLGTLVRTVPHGRTDPRRDRRRGRERIKIVKLNVDENQQYAGKLGVFNIPTMILYKDGQPVDKIVGAMPKTAAPEPAQPAPGQRRAGSRFGDRPLVHGTAIQSPGRRVTAQPDQARHAAVARPAGLFAA